MTATLAEKILAWLSNYGGDPNELPTNTTVIALEGDAYVRWTPAWADNPPTITIAKIRYEEELRGQGRFTALLDSLFAYDDCVICVEAVMNERLAAHLNSLSPPGRVLLVTGGMLPRCPTFFWSPR